MGKNPRSWEMENGPRAFFAFVAMTSFFFDGKHCGCSRRAYSGDCYYGDEDQKRPQADSSIS